MGLLTGKTVVVTGVLTDQSIAFHIARLAQDEGAGVILTSFGRTMSLTKRSASRLPTEPAIVELDVTNDDDLAQFAARLGEHCETVDGLVHSIGFAPESALGGNFLHTPWPDVATAMQVSAYSLASLTMATKPRMGSEASVVGLDFDASVAWPTYDWMGVAKAALESTARYLARDLGPEGIRVNLVAAGPIRTMAAKSIPGFDEFEKVWLERAPLGWDLTDPAPAARACVALLSPWFAATTGEIVHVDGGVHSQGA
ncbi:MAG: enoyl-ACP reductase FabI [Candidatus Nanopelagicales bacterium]|nr:enoyl-ACP reductase FabI [Candidatus Nanopelagicales bacterium]MCH9678352.1 enoyl-ACP reductase FabI [Actinomycetes bacterium]MCH9707017.1 enoyl-ACP reductase FabI [Actinomycetes bacterium]NKB93048.1 enoyl-ACP reductase FabI [Candidatus Nanopelagicales bacterium]|tara:strand:+ start:214 stop:981 length:768 start_codon:yes stop_codon:yes gene_type:complete